LASDEMFADYIKNVVNAEYEGFPATELSVKLDGVDLSDYFDLY